MGDKRRVPVVSRWAALVSALAISLCQPSPARAQEQHISEMLHTTWLGRDGAPQGISALAQTPDGVLWIAGVAGLFQFDGIAFEPFRPPPGSPSLSTSGIHFLFVSKTGDLWLFFYHGAPVRIRRGEVRSYGRVDGESLEVIGEAQEAVDGTLWAVLNGHHLIRLGPDDVWHQMPDPIRATGHISKLFIDSNDTQWVIENNVLYRRPQAEAAFTATQAQVFGPAKIIAGRDRSLWVLGQGPGPGDARNLQHVDEIGRPQFAPNVDGALSDMVIAADDSLWLSNLDAGVQRIAGAELSPSGLKSPGPDAQDFYPLKGGTTDFPQPLLRDRDDNIWVGGTGGLERFEHADMVPALTGAKVGVWFNCVDTDGGVWVGNGNGQLFTLRAGRAHEVERGDNAYNLLCGTDGRVYFLHDSGITLVRGGHVRRLPLLPGFGGHGDHYEFLGLQDEPDGRVIATVGGVAVHGLFTFETERWSRFRPDLALPEVSALLDVPGSGLYLAFTAGPDRAGKLKTNTFEMVSVPFRPMGFVQTSYGVVAYGRNGIAIERDGRFHELSFQHPDEATLVTGLVESRNRDLWLIGARGVVRVPADEIRAAAADWSHPVSSTNLREGDFVGPDAVTLFKQSAHIDPSGRLWFSTLNGVIWVDPDHLGPAREPPHLSIRTMTADGRTLNENATLAPDTQYVEVKYFGLDLSHPRDVVYRYRLLGLNTAWLDVGDHTGAIYTHLRPGQYTFQVMASNGNDVWTAPVSSVTFSVLPYLYQRAWVQLLVLLLVAAATFALATQRVRSITKLSRIRAEERAEERIRIARDLHDTLLQSVQGLLLSFHVAAEKVPAGHESKPSLEKALATADRMLIEGRNRVTRLRSEHLSDAELKPAIECVADDLNVGDAVSFAVHRRGCDRVLDLHVVDEIFSIAREALANAFRHSEATRIDVELDYQPNGFKMSCRDNGHGFAVDATLAAAPNAHWGLRGMMERAGKVGASFSCQSAAGMGTEVRVVVPAWRAYVRPRGGRWWRLSAAVGLTKTTSPLAPDEHQT
jgi:signal transduction histidine kinase/ligand-binding sensor domain-containing protein